MSTTAARDRERGDLTDGRVVRTRTDIDETKASFKTTEMIAYIATVAAVVVTALSDDAIDARLAIILVSALGIGYMLSRGLAKSGSTHRDHHDDY